MADLNVNGLFLNYLLSALYRKVIVPNDFHTQSIAIMEMMRNDVSGLVNSLTDFQVHAATGVSYHIHTGNNALDKILKEWFHNINADYNGKIPSGVHPLANQYYQERWKGSSFPILKIIDWTEQDGLMLPSKMAFVEGGSVYSRRVSIDQNYVDLCGYDYFLGRRRDEEDKLEKNCIITKPFCRWHNEYPVPYLIKNGVYYNWKLIQSLKDKQAMILDQILPYLLTVQKGTEQLAVMKDINYDDDKLKKVAGQMEEVIQRMNDFQFDGQRKSKTPIRVTQFDEEIKHLIPDLGTILKQDLFTVFEKGILCGMGFIDVADAVSSNRKESILNPKAFIQEVDSGIGDFKQIVKEMTLLIKRKNKDATKYTNLDWKIETTKPQIFITSDFRDMMLSIYNRGAISKKTLVETVGDCDYTHELDQRKHEAKNGDDFTMYPPVVQNVEVSGENDYGGTQKKDSEKDIKTPQEKLGPDAKMKYNKASITITELETAGYKSITKLPDSVKEALPAKKDQRKWLATWNSAYAYAMGKWDDKKRAETYAFSVAYGTAKHENNKPNAV